MPDEDDDDKTSIRPLSDLLNTPEVPGRPNPYLIVLSGKSVGRMFKLNPGEVLIGRSPDCDLMLDDDGVSRKHARLICRPDGTVSILDLGSTNGTWVEAERMDLHRLQDGNRIQIGSATILKYGYQDSVEEKFVSQLYESATQDGLTGIYNKRFFLDHLKQELAWHQRHGHPLTLILFDIDFFKRINDTYGHQAGDFVLKRLAKVCGGQVRTEDILARYGGEEFAVILRQTESKQATVLAERIRRAVEGARFDYSAENRVVSIPVAISVGVAELDPTMIEPAALIEAADRYLYKAKEGGRNRVESSAFD